MLRVLSLLACLLFAPLAQGASWNDGEGGTSSGGIWAPDLPISGTSTTGYWGGSGLALDAPLRTSIIPRRGGTPTYARALTATVTDHEGIERYAKSNEARFRGARRVENLVTALTTHTITVVNGAVYQARIKGTNGTTAVFSGAFTGTLTADGTNAISWPSGTPKTASSASLTITVTGTLTELLVSEVTGASNQNPPTYVDFAVSHGANATGVKYFDTLNGNTVDANGVVTEATGAAISPAPYYEYDIQRTYAGLWSDDLTNAAWVKTTMTATKDQTGADGRANSATRLTATAANATVLQTLTSSSQKRITQAHVKRITGSGTIEMTQDNGTTWTPVTVTPGWTQVYIPEVTSANPVFGFRIVTSGDEIAVQYVNHVLAEGGVTSPVTTTTTLVTRNADSLTYPMPVGLDTKGSAYAEAISLSGVSGSNIIGGAGSITLGEYGSCLGYRNPGESDNASVIYDGTQATGVYDVGSWASGRKITSRWGNGKMRNFTANTAWTEANFDGSMGAGPISVAPLRGRSGVAGLKIWKSIKSDTYLQGLTQ